MCTNFGINFCQSHKQEHIYSVLIITMIIFYLTGCAGAEKVLQFGH